MSEMKIMREVLLRLGSRPDVRLWRQNVGTGWVPAGNTFRPQAFGVKGQPDLMGCVRINGVGVWLGVETKSETGKQREAQRDWQTIMESFGGIYILARSPDEAERALEVAIVEAKKRMAA